MVLYPLSFLSYNTIRNVQPRFELNLFDFLPIFYINLNYRYIEILEKNIWTVYTRIGVYWYDASYAVISLE
jgi:hypothetical protein